MMRGILGGLVGGIGRREGEIGGLRSWVRYMSRKRGENLRKINPKVSYPDALTISQSLYNAVRDHGPLTIGSTWTVAQEAGVSGLMSKTHMKILLKWMRGKNMLKQICQHVGSNKKFLLCTPEAFPALQEKMSTEVKFRSQKKSSKKAKKRKA